MVARVIIALFLGGFLLSCANTYTEESDFDRNVREYFLRSEKEKLSRTPEENKLANPLYLILKLAEEADTSQDKKARLQKYLTSDGQITVMFELWSVENNAQVAETIKSLGGGVEWVGKNVPAIQCSIHPKSLRKLIMLTYIRRITIPRPGGHY